MPVFRASVYAEPSATDNALVRWDTTTGQDVQDSPSVTLTDADVLTLADSTAQVVLAGTATTVTFAGVTLTPVIISNQPGSLSPTIAMARTADGATAAPTHNFFRTRATTPFTVQSGDTLGIISASGFDSVDQAQGAQIDFAVDGTPGSNDMPGRIRFLTTPDGTQNPTLKAQILSSGGIQWNSQTLLTNANVPAGLLEYDGKVAYFANEAANRGVVQSSYFIRLDATHTLANSAARQPLFDSVGLGALTLPTGLYFFQAMASISVMSGTSGNAKFAIKGDGTATVTDYLWAALALDNAVGTLGATSYTMNVTDETPEPVASATTNTALQCIMMGTFAVTGAGTIIPAVELTTGVATAVVAIGSYFRCWPVGADNVQTAGPWS